jgi:hypothetical protein
MTRSKFIPTMLAAFCGLGLQFQTSGANAQTYGTLNGINLVYFTPTDYFPEGYEIYSPNNNYYLTIIVGDLVLFGPSGQVIWSAGMSSSFTGPVDSSDHVVFQSDGNLVIRNANLDDEAIWRTGTTDWNGHPGYFMAIQDDGNFVIYDINWNWQWAASLAPGYPCNC